MDSFYRMSSPLGTPPSSPNRHPSSRVGICFDAATASIGVFNYGNVGNPFEVVAEAGVEIALTNNHFLVGSNAAIFSARDNFFDVVTLLRAKSSERYKISVRNTDYFLTSEDLISLFLSHLLQKFKEVKKSNVDFLVLTMTFYTSSACRERLRTAAELVGLSSDRIRIVSSLTAATISYVMNKNGDKADFQSLERSRTVFICQYSKTTFSMALVEVKDGSVTEKRSLSMENLPEFHNPSFLSTHAHLFANGIVSDNFQYWVYQAYQKGFKTLTADTEVIESYLLINPAKKSSFKIENMIRDVLKRPLKNLDSHTGPLKGACFLATQDSKPLSLLSNLRFPSRIVGERKNFKLLVNGQPYLKQEEDVVAYIDSQNLLVFSFPFNVKGRGKLVIQLEEEVCHNQLYHEVCAYCLVFECLYRNETETLKLDCSLSYDGIYSLYLSQKPQTVQVSMVRTDNVVANNLASADVKILKKVYAEKADG